MRIFLELGYTVAYLKDNKEEFEQLKIYKAYIGRMGTCINDMEYWQTLPLVFDYKLLKELWNGQ